MSPSKTPLPPTAPSSIMPDYPEVNWENIDNHPIKKRSIVLQGHKTSLSIEAPFWSQLLRLSAGRECSVSDIILTIDQRPRKNLSSAVRLYLFDCQRALIDKLILQNTRLKLQNAKLRGIADLDDITGPRSEAPTR